MQEEISLPCQIYDDCPYEYANNPERDIEGMPLIDNDPRSCPDYGHICPEFMEDFGFDEEDLRIRAIIHCGGLMLHRAGIGELDLDRPEYKVLLRTYKKTLLKYPPEEYPDYYTYM